MSFKVRCSSPTASRAISRTSTRRTAPSSTRSASGTASSCVPRRSRGCGAARAWHGEPVFAYGFEDLTAAEWSLLEALAGRTDVAVSLPYEQGRTAFASLQRTAEDLADLADGRIEELPPAYGEVAPPALAYLERALFEEPGPGAPPLEGAVAFLEGAGVRGALELVGDELLQLVRGGTAPDAIGVVCPSLGRWRAPLETAFRTLGIPYAFDGRGRLAETPFGHSLLALLRYAWAGRHPCRPLRVSPLAVLGADPRARRLRRGAAARAGGGRAGADRGGPAGASRLAASPARRAAGGDAGGRRRPRARAVDAARGARARAPAGGREPARATSAHSTPACACSTSSARGSARVEEPVSADDVIATLERARDARRAGRAGQGHRARSRARTHGTLRGRLRARARGGKPAAARRRVAVPRRRGPRKARRPAAARRTR